MEPSMRKYLASLIVLAAIVGTVASSFGGSMMMMGAGKQPAAAAWTPASLGSALVAWYKADVGVTSGGNGTPITGWADQSGNSNNLVKLVGSNNSTFHSTGLGGKESTGFVLSGAMVTAATDTMTNMGTGNLSSAFVLGSVTTNGGGTGMGYAAAGQTVGTGANSAAWFFLSATPDFTFDHAFGTGTAQSVTANTETRMGMIFDGTNATPYKNNVAGSANALNFSFTSPGTLIVGAGSGGWDGEIREIIITNTMLSSGDRASLDAYLVSRH
jgi:hypothetical protein